MYEVNGEVQKGQEFEIYLFKYIIHNKIRTKKVVVTNTLSRYNM